jgi:hypothetical protein
VTQLERDLERLPPNFRAGLRLYIEQGVTPGSFLTACLDNDLIGAVVRADPVSIVELPVLMRWIHNYMPSAAWGSPDKRLAWQNDHRAP